MKRTPKKLVLHRESLRLLPEDETDGIAGGARIGGCTDAGGCTVDTTCDPRCCDTVLEG